MGFQTPMPEEFERKVREQLREWQLGERFYVTCIGEIHALDLHKLTEDDVKRVIRPFLIMWGQMKWVLQRRGRRGWEKRLVENIRGLANTLERLRRDLAKIDDEELNQLDEDIKKCYSEIRRIVGPTSASKVLHLIAPKFFPLWDRGIRNLYGYGTKTGESGYLRFIHEIRRRWLREEALRETLSKLKREYRLSKLRIIDVYNWIMSRDTF